MQQIRFFQQQEKLEISRQSELLDSSFRVNQYTENFPHIFDKNSPAQIFLGVDTSNCIVSMCAVDTEIWSEPFFLRGACIGSVAVAPSFQGQGIGRQMLGWVCRQLVEGAKHDFAYLFSDRPEFYQSVGFTPVGREVLSRPKFPQAPVLSSQYFFHPPMSSTSLSDGDIFRLWIALERGRRIGESHASLAKLKLVLAIPQMFVSWVENGQGQILAGAFCGKGIDFGGVVHTLFARDDFVFDYFVKSFLTVLNEQAQGLLIAEGLWHSQLSKFCEQRQNQNLCLVKHLSLLGISAYQLFNERCLYPRALFSS